MRLWALLVLALVAGCSHPAPKQVSFSAKPQEPEAKWSSAWGQTRYAPKQTAGAARDQSGLYCNLHGTQVPHAVAVGIMAEENGKYYQRTLWFDSSSLTAWGMQRAAPSLGRPGELTAEQFRWIGEPVITKLAGTYGRTFWVSWKALGLDGEPKGPVRVLVEALERQGQGAVFTAEP